ncbi:MAG: hypothetical protein IKS20_11425, partial [Victivallales bacterium]|nr:hypothetical protein [Victivallales bacterium]
IMPTGMPHNIQQGKSISNNKMRFTHIFLFGTGFDCQRAKIRQTRGARKGATKAWLEKVLGHVQ